MSRHAGTRAAGCGGALLACLLAHRAPGDAARLLRPALPGVASRPRCGVTSLRPDGISGSGRCDDGGPHSRQAGARVRRAVPRASRCCRCCWPLRCMHLCGTDGCRQQRGCSRSSRRCIRRRCARPAREQAAECRRSRPRWLLWCMRLVSVGVHGVTHLTGGVGGRPSSCRCAGPRPACLLAAAVAVCGVAASASAARHSTAAAALLPPRHSRLDACAAVPPLAESAECAQHPKDSS